MPQVPQAPQESPEHAQMGFQSVPGANAEAFGAGLARSISGAGQSVDHLGDVLAGHAVAFQNIQNEADANVATTDYLMQQGELQNQFKELQGRDPAANYAEHVKKLQALREDLRSKLPNPMVQKMFDQSTMRQFGYAVNGDSAYAASQNRAYRGAASKAKVGALQDVAAQSGTSDEFKTNLDEIENTVRTDPDNDGQAPEVIEQKIREGKSKAWVKYLDTMADPLKAAKLFKDNRQDMDGLDALALEEKLNRKIVVTGSKVIGENVANGGPTTTVQDRENWGMSYLTSRYGKAAAAGLLGNAHAESNLDPGAESPHDGHDGSAAIGIAQWNGERAKELKQFAIDRGLDFKDYRTQVQFMDYELTTSHKDLGAALRGVTDPAVAAKMIEQEYERPKAELANSGTRIANAVRISQRDVKPPGLTAVSTQGNLTRMENEARTQAKKQADALGLDDTTSQLLQDGAAQDVAGRFAKVATAHRDEITGNKLVVYDGLYDPDAPPTTKDELFAKGQEVEDAYYRLPAEIKDKVDRRLAGNLVNKPATPEREARYQQLRGMAADPDTRKEFVEMDLSEEDLSIRDVRSLMNEQRTAKKDMDSPVPVQAVFTKLQAIGMFDGTVFNKKGADQHRFMGALQLAIEERQGEKAGKLSDEELKSVGRDVFQQMVVPGKIWGKNYDRTSTPDQIAGRALVQSVPLTARDTIVEAFTSQTGRRPTDRQIREIYANPKNKGAFE